MHHQDVHPKIAHEQLGHPTVGGTLDIYGRVRPNMQREAAGKIDAAEADAQQLVSVLRTATGVCPSSPENPECRSSWRSERSALCFTPSGFIGDALHQLVRQSLS